MGTVLGTGCSPNGNRHNPCPPSKGFRHESNHIDLAMPSCVSAGKEKYQVPWEHMTGAALVSGSRKAFLREHNSEKGEKLVRRGREKAFQTGRTGPGAGRSMDGKRPVWMGSERRGTCQLYSSVLESRSEGTRAHAGWRGKGG